MQSVGLHCINCGAGVTTTYRASDSTEHRHCNVCGFHSWNKTAQPIRAVYKKVPNIVNEKNEINCANCHTNDTTLWRRNNRGEQVCNACGLYYRLHGVSRPLSMKKETIQKRKRKQRTT